MWIKDYEKQGLFHAESALEKHQYQFWALDHKKLFIN